MPRKVSNNQPNLNAAMIAEHSVPHPPLDIQHEIVRQAGTAREREMAERKAQEVEVEIEALILGTQKVET